MDTGCSLISVNAARQGMFRLAEEVERENKSILAGMWEARLRKDKGNIEDSITKTRLQ
jgi:hypothetical protein